MASQQVGAFPSWLLREARAASWSLPNVWRDRLPDVRVWRTFTGEQLRLEAMARRLNDPDVVGTIWRWDHLDLLTDCEAEWWDFHALPFGWWIRSDARRVCGGQVSAQSARRSAIRDRG